MPPVIMVWFPVPLNSTVPVLGTKVPLLVQSEETFKILLPETVRVAPDSISRFFAKEVDEIVGWSYLIC